MRMLSINEFQYVSGAAVITTETWAYMDQVLSNTLDGASTGMAIGGKWGGAGGIIFGATSQLVGLIVPAIMGGILGMVSSITIGYEATGLLLNDYREKFGTA
ncbi:hypothetical protein N1689_19680 [Pantoea sp. XY16]|uniref:DUF5862 family protein n=1 Tax=Pantoea sp. XY16 TaxID=2976705 RepID=UPI0021A2AE73|nr:hypothetical protein [Pantoea sp. XY16]MCT2420071.1 hypothetical protein [Pantoea sp. XY16]